MKQKPMLIQISILSVVNEECCTSNRGVAIILPPIYIMSVTSNDEIFLPVIAEAAIPNIA